MMTIRTLIAERLRFDAHGVNDGAITDEVRKHLKKICAVFPNDTPEGREFSEFISKEMPEYVTADGKKGKLLIGTVADEIIEKGIATLTGKVMDERDDLSDYPHLRSKLVEAIGKGR